jgi:hypothetical protein
MAAEFVQRVAVLMGNVSFKGAIALMTPEAPSGIARYISPVLEQFREYH